MKKREGSRFGEGLRMSKKESEAEDREWVHMHIFEGWSHGYLQMATLMHEAREAIDDIAGWMMESFGQAQERAREREREEEGEVLTFTPRKRRSPAGSSAKVNALGIINEGAQPPRVEVGAPTRGRQGRLSSSSPLASLTEEELMRRRRMAAVEGIHEPVVMEGSAVDDEEGSEDMRIAYGF